MKRTTSIRAAPVRLEPAPWQAGETLTFLAMGNLVKVENDIKIWCLFCDTQKQYHESLENIEKIPYFRVGSRFNNGHLINSHSVEQKYDFIIHPEKMKADTIPERLLLGNFSGLQGNYQNQQFIKVRNKQVQLVDVLMRMLCPDPGFGKIIFKLLSQSFIFRNVMPDGDHLHLELENIYKFQLTKAVATQFAWLAASEEYRGFQRGIPLHLGRAFSSPEGGVWSSPLPDFKVRVSYSPIQSSGPALVYRVAKCVPLLPQPFRKMTIHEKGSSRTIQL